jgi:hypothetical protein
MMEPLHIATLPSRGHRLRFFRSPLDDGRPDFPWHAVNDLHRCLGLNGTARKYFLNAMQKKKWPMRTVATSEGLVTIAPHFVAHGTVDALISERRAPAAARNDYDLAGTEACKKLTAHLQDPSDDLVAWLKAALSRWED